MKGIGKRVTIAFLSIAALLSVSGVIALVELRNLSYDAEGVLAVGGQEMNVAKRLLHSAHDHRRSVIDVAIFEDAKGEGRSSKAKECIDEIIANESKDATGSVKASLDTLSVCIANMQKAVDNFVPSVSIMVDSLVVEQKIDARKWYTTKYEPLYTQFVEQVEAYTQLSHDQLAPRAEELSKNAHRSVVPVFISLLVMIVVVLLFYYFVYIYIVKPILRINKGLSDYLQFKAPYKVKAEMVDQIRDLNDNVETLINMSRNQKNQ
jgi:hypothetical protein